MRNCSKMKVAIVGLGQIGGSLAKAFAKRKTFAETIGVDKNLKTLEKAKKLRIVNRISRDLKKAIPQADLIILAVPIRQILKLLPEVVSLMKKDAILCDVGSTKTEVFKVVSNLKQKVDYVGLHPMAGTEREGINGADENLFVNKIIMVFPSKNTQKTSLEFIVALIKKLEARPLVMNAKKHDEVVAQVSHLPYLFSIALVNLTDNSNLKVSPKVLGGSFRDTTRVALSAPEMMLDILTTNKKNIIRQVEALRVVLRRYKGFLANEDEKTLWKEILKAKRIRGELKLK